MQNFEGGSAPKNTPEKTIIKRKKIADGKFEEKRIEDGAVTEKKVLINGLTQEQIDAAEKARKNKALKDKLQSEIDAFLAKKTEKI